MYLLLLQVICCSNVEISLEQSADVKLCGISSSLLWRNKPGNQWLDFFTLGINSPYIHSKCLHLMKWLHLK